MSEKKKVQGKVVRSDLEGGHWVFEAVSGERYQLHGGGDDLLKDGQNAVIEGEVDGGMIGIGMTGPVLKVEFYELK